MRSLSLAFFTLSLLAYNDCALAYGAKALGHDASGKPAGGISYDQATPELARQVALESCRKNATACSVVREFSESCIVLYLHPSSGEYFTVPFAAPDPKYGGPAGEAAQRACSGGNPSIRCRFINTFCDSKERTQNSLRDVQNTERARKETAEKEQRKPLAIADCGASPSVSGGPWFSSTYKIGALDEALRATQMGALFCVKTVEFVSDAPNPFGGKAARARFIGYDGEYRPRVEVRDFPY